MSVTRTNPRGPSLKSAPEAKAAKKKKKQARNRARNEVRAQPPVRSEKSVAAARAAAAARISAPPPPAATKPDPIRMITYNTAVGNSKIKTAQEDFLELPFYQDVLQGRPNAPILNLQEVGPRQIEALQAAEKSGKFRMFYAGRPGGTQGGQYNAMLIPKRFEVLQGDSQYFAEQHARGLGKSLWNWAKGGFDGKPSTQWIEPRMWTHVRLKDAQSGKVFTVMNTHLSLDPNIRVEQAKKLRDEAVKAKKYGPVVLAGDLNTRAPSEALPANASPQAAADAKVRKMLWSVLTDMGATQEKMNKSNIDYVLASGFNSVSTNIYQGGELTLPGLPSADKVSDHYAEENVLEFA